jgi:hypothetical protein
MVSAFAAPLNGYDKGYRKGDTKAQGLHFKAFFRELLRLLSSLFEGANDS